MIASGTRLGPYTITASIGAGGMGEVYRARDTRLKRDVALKMLPESFATDADRLARFQREAEVLASLNHPNIAGIYGIEESNGTKALVMELVDGPTLADRIARGPIPVEEALPIARQVAEALEAAHEQGIIHRDLKPANIKLRPDGTVKVLDFGLAKALEPASSANVNATASPTITSPAMRTGVGMLLGTAAYMSPEQARGKAVDKRSDIWAFGCVLYEMLTGRRLFEREDVPETLAAVLRDDPDWSVLRADVPPPVRTLIRGCLVKDRRHRVADLSTALFVIDRHVELAVARDASGSSPAWRVGRVAGAVLAAAVMMVAIAAGYVTWSRPSQTARAVTRLAIPLAADDAVTAGSALALSPDGTRLAYVVNHRLYLRALDQLDPVPIAGGGGPAAASPRTPFFSPDGRWTGFWEAGQIKKVSVTGGAPVSLWETPAGTPNGARWEANDTILVGYSGSGIWRVPGDGGGAERIVSVDAGERVHGPQLLPDGRTLLFTLAQTASWDEAQIVVQSLDGGSRKTVIRGGTHARFLAPGHLLYVHRDSVLAVPFDAASLSVRGAPVQVVSGVRRDGGAQGATAQFTVAGNGTLAYIPAETGPSALRTLVWVDRRGREEPIPAEPRSYSRPRVAPDGTRLALAIEDDNQNADVWIWDFPRRTLGRVTSDPTDDLDPIWTPDGERVIFSSLRTGRRHLYRQAANGTGMAEHVVEGSGQVIIPYTMSPDGRHLVYRTATQGNSDLTIVQVGDGRAMQSGSSPARLRGVAETTSEEINAAISPDGSWLAYQSNTSGTFEVYVRPFPDVDGGRWLVSTGGGVEPLWSRDGRELFYRSPTGAVMIVSIAPGPAWKAGTPTRLFEGTSYVLTNAGDTGPAVSRTYDVAPDGQRFLMLKNVDVPASASTTSRIIVVQHWTEELKRLVPTN